MTTPLCRRAAIPVGSAVAAPSPHSQQRLRVVRPSSSLCNQHKSQQCRRHVNSTISTRLFSTSSASSTTSHTSAIPLAYDKITFGRKSNVPTATAIFSHSLLGNRQMWPRRFRQQLDHLLQTANITLDGYFVDLRNHGESGHTQSHTYNDMAADIDLFVTKLKLRQPRPFMIGFSMGSKAAMAWLLKYGTLQNSSGLISLDACPATYTHSHERFFQAMEALDVAKCTSIAEADRALVNIMPRMDERSFLLTNLTKSDDGAGLKWIINYPVLWRYERNIHGFDIGQNQSPPQTASASQSNSTAASTPTSQSSATRSTTNTKAAWQQWEGPALFIGGNESSRLTTLSYTDEIPKYFPNAQIKMVDSGHFIQQEQPFLAAQLIANFISKHTSSR